MSLFVFLGFFLLLLFLRDARSPDCSHDKTHLYRNAEGANLECKDSFNEARLMCEPKMCWMPCGC